VQPATASVNAALVDFIAKNEGQVVHELVVIRSNLEPDKLPVQSGRVPEEQVDMVDETRELQPGKSETLTVQLESAATSSFATS
jgi:uncharacterized cupredoxin-like copper-binding protein